MTAMDCIHIKPRPLFYKKKNTYRLQFNAHNTQFRGPYISQKKLAYILQSKINTMVLEYKCGFLTPPNDLSLSDFIFGSVIQKTGQKEIFPLDIITLSRLLDEYQEEIVPPTKAASTCKIEKTHINHLRRFAGRYFHREILLEEINVGFFNRYKKFRYTIGQVLSDTVNKELGTFQAIFNYAIENEYILENVVCKVKRDKSQSKADRFHTHTEVMEMLRTGNYSDKEKRTLLRFRFFNPQEINEIISLTKGKMLYPILITIAFTGARRSEIISLRWIDIDFDRNVIWIRSRKQSRKRESVPRIIPMHPKLAKILQKHKASKGKGEWVFTREDGRRITGEFLREIFRSTVKGTKFQGIGYHALRHSLPCNLAMEGEDSRIIDNIMGHQSAQMRKRYFHLFPAPKEKAIERLKYLEDE